MLATLPTGQSEFQQQQLQLQEQVFVAVVGVDAIMEQLAKLHTQAAVSPGQLENHQLLIDEKPYLCISVRFTTYSLIFRPW